MRIFNGDWAGAEARRFYADEDRYQDAITEQYDRQMNAEREAWLDAEFEAEQRDERQNREVLYAGRYVDYSDVENPEQAQILAHEGHVYHYSPGSDE